jgi:hypothetical protein
MTLAQECKHLSRALNALENTSANEENRNLYFSRLIAVRDERERLYEAKEDGKAEGMKQGMAESIEKAFALLEKGMSIEEAKKILRHK